MYGADSYGDLINSIRLDHPRLYFTQATIKEIKKRLLNESNEDFNKLATYVKWLKLKYTDEQLARVEKCFAPFRDIAFYSVLKNDLSDIKSSIAYGLAIADIEPEFGDDTAKNERVLSLAILYDWFFSYLTVDNRQTIQNAILKNIKQVSYIRYLLIPNYVAGHSHHNNVGILAGCLALYGHTDEVNGWLVKCLDNWINGFNEYRAFMANDGGWLDGWAYVGSYNRADPFAMVYSATGKRLWGDWYEQLIYFIIYGMRGDSTFARLGDIWSGDYHQHISSELNWLTSIVTTCTYIFKNPYAAWFLKKHLDSKGNRFWSILYASPDITQKSPHKLPLHRLFEHAGIAVCRDGWGDDATVLIFKSAPFIFPGHQHLDQNHLTLSCKGTLLADTGIYDSFGSPHYRNYYSRTIAHNSVIILDSESFNRKELSNIGGQVEPIGWPRYLSDIQSKYAGGGIISYKTDGHNYSLMKGDASLSYDSVKLSLYTRDVFFINNPINHNAPYILIIDDIELKSKGLPTQIFHSVSMPQIAEDTLTISNSNNITLKGYIFSQDSAEITMQVIENDAFLVDGFSYMPTRSVSPTVDATSNCIKIASTKESLKKTLLTFFVVSKNQFDVERLAFINEGSLIGLILSNGVYLINLGTPEEITDQLGVWNYPIENEFDIYVANLKPSHKYQITLNSKIYSMNSDENGVVNGALDMKSQGCFLQIK